MRLAMSRVIVQKSTKRQNRMQAHPQTAMPARFFWRTSNGRTLLALSLMSGYSGIFSRACPMHVYRGHDHAHRDEKVSSTVLP